jgi:hypothetical protein
MLMISSLFLPSFFASPVSAQGGAVVVSGSSTAYNMNASGVGPDVWYTSSPLIMAAQRIGSGAVVAGGLASSCRDDTSTGAGRWNEAANRVPHLDVFLDVAFKWMVPGATKVLWYEGYGVYDTAARCTKLVSALENLGYTVTSDSTQPITASLLAPYDIMVIPQLEISSPDLLPDADVEVIRNFVEGGKGLLIMDQSDYQGFNYYTVHNKILTGLGFAYWFQHDQAADNVNDWGGANFQLITNVDATTPIGSAYQARTGSTEIGLYSICTLMPATPPPEHQVSVSSSDGGQLGTPGVNLTFHMTLKNVGLKSDIYTLTVGDNLGWSLSISTPNASLASGGSVSFTAGVVIPSGLTSKVADEIVVRAVGASGAEDNTTLVAAAHVPENLEYPIVELIPGEIYYWFSANTLRVESPAVPIICGTETGFSTDLAPREPWPMLYGEGEYPPIAAVQLVGNGRVLAAGGLPILRSLPVSQFPDSRLAAEELMPLMARWLENWKNPSGKKFLFYYTSGAFEGPSNLTDWLNIVDNELGFDLTTMEGGRITPELLAGYDVLQVVTEGVSVTDGDMLSIAGWVENGGALLLMDSADFGGYGNVPTTNKLLETIGCNIRFNDDELYDNIHWTKDGAWFPQVYLLDVTSVNPDFGVWFPATALSAQTTEATQYGVWKPGVVVGKGNDESVNFRFVVTNTGTEATTCVIHVVETTTIPLGWPVSMDQPQVTVPAGESREVIITVTVPYVNENQLKRTNWTATATAEGLSFVKSEATFMAVAEYVPPLVEPGVSLPMIAAAIVVVLAVIAIVAYWAIKIR